MFMANAEGAGVTCHDLGTVGGGRLKIDGHIDIAVEQLRNAHESWFPAYMEGGANPAIAAE